MRRIGIDVGSTHTDAVIMDGKEIIATCKAPTSSDIASGIVSAARTVLFESRIAGSSIAAVMIGTTQFTNAVVQRRGLTRVAALRVGAQSTSALPPFCDWPPDLEGAVKGNVAMINGGHEFDGKPVAAFDETAFDGACNDIARAGLDSLSVCSMFSSVNPETELWIRQRVTEQRLAQYTSLSSELGGIGIYQRENATLLNAALTPLAARTIQAFRSAFDELGLSAKLFISQNDGTLMQADFAARYPVLTISSGPTNSMRGAAHLTGLDDAMVIDVGGTTSDVGMLMNGFPRRSGIEVEIGGVLTNFRMPDVLAIGLGGGSHVEEQGNKLGPLSVGHELAKKALCFAGGILTATDIACAAGRIHFGSAELVTDIDATVIDTAMVTIFDMYNAVIDRMKTGPDPLPLIAVGGGSFLIPDGLPGITEVIRPDYAGVANAVGAAIGKIGAEAEMVYSRSDQGRVTAHDEIRGQAIERAIAAGADDATVEITEVDEIPISYLEDPIVRLRVKAVGEMKL